MRTSQEIVRQLVGDGVTRDELAARLGMARETVSRWSRGRNEPSLEVLQQAAVAAGYQLEVRLEPAELKVVALVCDQLDLGPTDRLRALLGHDWPAARDALRAAAAVRELGILVGPLAAALSGAPQRPSGHVDLVVAAGDREAASERLLLHGAHPDGIEQSGEGARSGRRERWQAGAGILTVCDRAIGVDGIDVPRARAMPVKLNGEDVGMVHVGYVEDLLALAEASSWSEDSVQVPGLRAVLASGRYRSRRQPEEELILT